MSGNNNSVNFNKLGLLEKSKLLDRAKQLASDKTNLLKQALKERQQNDGSDDLIKSKFAQKLTDSQTGEITYMCIACKIKLPDNISAFKHFANGGTPEHKAAIE
jgi:PBP1b-binding outer membrane lipoprotein LpoB